MADRVAADAVGDGDHVGDAAAAAQDTRRRPLADPRERPEGRECLVDRECTQPLRVEPPVQRGARQAPDALDLDRRETGHLGELRDGLWPRERPEGPWLAADLDSDRVAGDRGELVLDPPGLGHRDPLPITKLVAASYAEKKQTGRRSP
jgi:hypothetical protein